MVYNAPNAELFGGHSFKIVLPAKPGHSKAKMDVCALTLSGLAQDSNLPSSKLPFPWKLYEMLETVEMVHKNRGDTDIVSWVDDGKAFKVHNLERFVEEIVPKYFKQTKYKSFQRQLYIYGFTRATASSNRGQTTGSYSHPDFLRGKKILCLSMQPKKTKKRSTAFECRESQKKKTNTSTSKVDNVDVTSNRSDDDNTPTPFAIQMATGAIRGAGVANVDISKAYSDKQTKESPFSRQQNQLLRLQREQFLKMLDPQQSCTHGQQVQLNLGEEKKHQQKSEVEEQPYCIFGGKLFHSVSKSGYFEYNRNRNSIEQKQFYSRDN